MAHLLATPGDQLVATTSGSSSLRVHATLRQDGKVGVMLANDSTSRAQLASVTISGVTLAGSGTWFQFGATNFAGTPTNPTPTFPVSSNSVSGLGNSFSVIVPTLTMIDILIPTGIVTSVSLTTSASPSTYGVAPTFTAAVQTNGTAVGSISGETITFYDGAVPLGTGTLDGTGHAAFTPSATQLSPSLTRSPLFIPATLLMPAAPTRRRCRKR